MAKSLRSKVKRRHRTLKRQYISQVKEIKDKQELSNRLQATINNVSYREKEKKNAFKFPNSADSHFPQYKKQDLIDFRSSSIPFAGTEFSGAYRKKKNLEKDIEKPEIEVEEIKEEEDIEVISENIEENVDIDDLDFEKIKISGKKKIKKSDQEKGIIYFKTKEIQRKKHEKKKQRSCKKSRKSMKF